MQSLLVTAGQMAVGSVPAQPRMAPVPRLQAHNRRHRMAGRVGPGWSVSLGGRCPLRAAGWPATVSASASETVGQAGGGSPAEASGPSSAHKDLSTRLRNASEGTEVAEIVLEQDSLDEGEWDDVNVATALSQLAALQPGEADAAAVDRLRAHLALGAEGYGARALCTAFQSLARLRQADQSTCEACATQVLTRPPSAWTGIELSGLVWAWLRVWQMGPDRARAVLDVLAPEISSRDPTSFTPADVASLSLSFAKAPQSYPEAMAKLAPLAASFRSQLTPRQLAMVLWAFTTPGCFDSEVVNRTTQALMKVPHLLQPVGLAMVASACARSSQAASPRLVESLVRQVTKKAGYLPAQQLSKCAWSFARLRAPSLDLWEAILRQAEAKLEDFSPSELANIAWALGRVPRTLRGSLAGSRKPLLDSMAFRLSQHTSRLQSGELAMALAGYAEAGIPSRRLYRDLGRELSQRAADLSCQDSVVVMRACAQAKRSPDGLLQLLADKLAKMETATPRELSIGAWALGKASLPHAGLLDSAATAMVGQPDAFLPKELVNCLWALCKLGHPDAESACQAVENQMELRPTGDFKGIDMSMICKAYGAVGYRLPARCTEYLERAKERSQKSRRGGSPRARGKAFK